LKKLLHLMLGFLFMYTMFFIFFERRRIKYLLHVYTFLLNDLGLIELKELLCYYAEMYSLNRVIDELIPYSVKVFQF